MKEIKESINDVAKCHLVDIKPGVKPTEFRQNVKKFKKKKKHMVLK